MLETLKALLLATTDYPTDNVDFLAMADLMQEMGGMEDKVDFIKTAAEDFANAEFKLRHVDPECHYWYLYPDKRGDGHWRIAKDVSLTVEELQRYISDKLQISSTCTQFLFISHTKNCKLIPDVVWVKW